jgi:ABC-type antimicrobial peptide transport system permease subunit
MAQFGYKVTAGRLLEPGDEGLVFGGQTLSYFYDAKRYDWPSYDMSKDPVVDVMTDKLSLTFDFSYGNRRSSDSGSQAKPKLYKTKGVGLISADDSNYSWSAFMDINVLKKMIKDNEKLNGSSGGSGGGAVMVRADGSGSSSSSSNSKTQEKYDMIRVKVDDIKNVPAVQEAITNRGYRTWSMNEILKEIDGVYNIIQLVLGGIGAISLFVAAIGITNTMIMSIYERTREIGVMKVIGASLGDIGHLFLFESACIGLLGGVLGIALSYILSFILNIVAQNTGLMAGLMGTNAAGSHLSIIPLWLVGAALAFSILVGLVSGYFPARRAMNLSALEAIKGE